MLKTCAYLQNFTNSEYIPKLKQKRNAVEEPFINQRNLIIKISNFSTPAKNREEHYKADSKIQCKNLIC